MDDMVEGWHGKQQYIRVRLSPGQYITEEEEEKIILHQINICMSFTMKMLAVSLLVVAMMALTRAAEAEVAPNTEQPLTEKEVEPESILDKEAEEPEGGSDEDDTEDNTDLKSDEEEHKIAKRTTLCPIGWTAFRERCFFYISSVKTWAEAQRHCQHMGGNLASVRNCAEDTWIKSFARHNPTWLGLSDAEQESFWFWSDGTRLTYTNWCHGEPSDSKGYQNCLQINWTDKKCWDDVQCNVLKGYVCARQQFSG